ncbi:Uncharacterised protein [uncultured archaeon]|nr:Uncharacterised protein [uncultured archaeon]
MLKQKTVGTTAYSFTYDTDKSVWAVTYYVPDFLHNYGPNNRETPTTHAYRGNFRVHRGIEKPLLWLKRWLITRERIVQVIDLALGLNCGYPPHDVALYWLWYNGRYTIQYRQFKGSLIYVCQKKSDGLVYIYCHANGQGAFVAGFKVEKEDGKNIAYQLHSNELDMNDCVMLTFIREFFMKLDGAVDEVEIDKAYRKWLDASQVNVTIHSTFDVWTKKK